MAVTRTSTTELPQIVRWITLGASALAIAVGLSLVGLSNIGSWLAVLGAATMTWNLHRLGRSGAS